MADNPIVVTPGKAFSVVEADQKTREPMTLGRRIKKLLGMADREFRVADLEGDQEYHKYLGM